MSTTIAVPDTVHQKAKELADERDMSIKEAIRYMCNEPRDFDV